MTETIENPVNQMCSLSCGIRLEGRAEGRTEGKSMAYCEMVLNGFIAPDVAAAALNQSEETLKLEYRNTLPIKIDTAQRRIAPKGGPVS